MQTFVFGHKNLLGGNHKDNLFGPQVDCTDPGDGSGVDLSSLTPAQQAQLTAKQRLKTRSSAPWPAATRSITSAATTTTTTIRS